MLPMLLSAVIMLASFFSTSSLRDAVTGGVPADVSFMTPALYIALSPLSRLFDIIGLLSIGQHVAFVTTIVGAAALFSAARPRGARRRSMRGLMSAGIFFALIAVAYALAIALPRPLTALAVAHRDWVRVDFHSHTNASRDARKSFDPEDNRAWHRAGGFDVAYVSDHSSFSGAEAALTGNPQRAGDGTVLLSAYEGRYRGLFMIFLGLSRADSAALLDSHRWLRAANLRSGRLPASVVAIPGPLIDVQREARDGPPRIVAMELVDGSPKGFTQHDHDRAEIISRADSLDIALVAGSNNHGWGRVVPAWTMVRIPGWQGLSADSLGAEIVRVLRADPRGAVRLVERHRPSPTSLAGFAITVPAFAVQTLAQLTFLERVAWVVWLWLIAFVAHRMRVRRTQP